MTTNVFCKVQNVLACDSRWTYENEDTKFDFFGFVDDTNWDKIFHSKENELGLLFAGNSNLIDAWKSWALSEIKVGERPEIDAKANFALCIVDLSPGEFNYVAGTYDQYDDCYVAGTGGEEAYKCWLVNNNARKAVETASSIDNYSGGQVKYLAGNGEHNLGSADKSAVKEKFMEEGNIMYLKEREIVPLKIAVEKDPRVRALADSVESGKINAQARIGSKPVIWTAAENQRLDDAISKIVARRRCA